MANLSERQLQILRAVVEEYTSTAEPVGSETLDKKYSLGISPATIRNEMAFMTKLGYLLQPHTSAGRIPSSKAIKLYINDLMREQELTVAEEVSAKESVWDKRNQVEDLLREAAYELARRTGSIGIVVTDNGKVYSAGYAHILDMPEFYDIDVTRTLFSLLDEANQLMAILYQVQQSSEIHVLLGDELGRQHLEPVSVICTNYRANTHSGALGVIGSKRFNYPKVIPLVRHFGQLVSQLAR